MDGPQHRGNGLLLNFFSVLGTLCTLNHFTTEWGTSHHHNTLEEEAGAYVQSNSPTTETGEGKVERRAQDSEV